MSDSGILPKSKQLTNEKGPNYEKRPESDY